MTDDQKIQFCQTMDHLKNSLLGSYTIRLELEDLVQTVSEPDQKAIVLSCIALLRTIALLGEGKAKEAANLAYGGIHQQAALFQDLKRNLASEEAVLAAMKPVGSLEN